MLWEPDMVYKSSNDLIIGIQGTRRDKRKRVIKPNPMKTFLEKMNLNDTTKLRIVLCPKPADAEEAKLS